MACPYFYPVEPQTSPGSAPRIPLPLGDLWAGECRATPLHPCRPGDDDLRPLCNFGYARGKCGHFPASPHGPDAVRFTISGDQGGLLRIYFVIERDHHPFAHGPLEYSTALGAFAAPPEGDNLERQACAYVESYFRHKVEAERR
jgi:hypothetical protein